MFPVTLPYIVLERSVYLSLILNLMFDTVLMIWLDFIRKRLVRVRKISGSGLTGSVTKNIDG